jgi:hypothetical protein
MAFYPFATWLGGSRSFEKDGVKKTLCSFAPMASPPKGLILHITDGIGGLGGPKGGEGGILTTFIETGSVSHFGIDQVGNVGQYIDTKFAETATENSGGWFSVECVQKRGNALTAPQVTSAGNLFAWLHSLFPTSIPLKPAVSMKDSGLGYHALFLTAAQIANSHHAGCPGDLVIAQRPSIIHIAKVSGLLLFPL